jgi:hypothetical protein
MGAHPGAAVRILPIRWTNMQDPARRRSRTDLNEDLLSKIRHQHRSRQHIVKILASILYRAYDSSEVDSRPERRLGTKLSNPCRTSRLLMQNILDSYAGNSCLVE